MPRYFFSLEDGRKRSVDESEDLADDEAARAVALEIARDLARNRDNLGNLRVVVRAANERILSEIPLKDLTQ